MKKLLTYLLLLSLIGVILFFIYLSPAYLIVKDVFVASTQSISTRGRSISSSYKSFYGYLRNISGLEEENQKLREENTSLNQKLAELTEKTSRLEYIEKQQDIISGTQNINCTYSLARVIKNNELSSQSDLVIDKGKKASVTKDSLILDNNLLIGKITDSANFTSTIQTIVHPNSKITAYVESKPEIQGILEGTIEKNSLNLAGLTNEEIADIEVGDRIISSGEDSIIPRGLVLGRISQIQDDRNLASKRVKVEVLFSTDNLNYVTICKRD